MNNYNDVRHFVKKHVGDNVFTMSFNDFYFYKVPKEYHFQSNLFIVSMLVHTNDIEAFRKDIRIKDNYSESNGEAFPGRCCCSHGEEYHRYHYCIIVTVDELAQVMKRTSSYYVSYDINFFSVSYSAYINFKNHFINNLHINIDAIRYMTGHESPMTHDDSFYVLIKFGHARDITDFNLLKQSLRTYCEEFTPINDTYIAAKNIDSKFMSKFNLVKDRLGVEIYGIIPGHEYLTKFED